MFYSDTLLSKTGPLARVWLASNMERKLSKKDCLSSDLEQSIEVMVDQGSAPMALRLSGQLLLGVVRIYSRKSRYLLEDVNEALLKIKMAFRPGNVDLPADQSHTVNPASLTLPDALTEFDLLAVIPDASWLLGQTIDATHTSQTINLDWGTQNLITDSIERAGTESRSLHDNDFDLGPANDDFSSQFEIERGRDRISELNEGYSNEQSKLLPDDLGLDLGDDDFPLAEPVISDVEMLDTAAFDLDNEVGAEINASVRQRDLETPLSNIRPSAERDLEITFNQSLSLFEPRQEEVEIEAEQEQSVVNAPKLKRRRIIQMDNTLELRSAQIKEQQADRSKILKEPSFLPRDPMLLALLSLQKSGGFVSSILGQGRTLGWAPELHDVLSIDVIKKAGNLKRKRDSGVADLFSDDENRLVIPSDESPPMSGGALDDEGQDVTRFEEPLDAGPQSLEDPTIMSPADDFDQTTMPLVPPERAGLLSQATQNAVHILRQQFSPTGEPSPSSRLKDSIFLDELIPEETTSRREATKMFFECLVLATKDAIKIEQRPDGVGGAIRLRAKRGLWATWAEEHVNGTQDTPLDAVASAEAGGYSPIHPPATPLVH